jgi:hypothetical protein
MVEIGDNGAIVDMSVLNFDNIVKEKQVKAAYIFLRNTSFKNIRLDFSNCDYEMKCQYLMTYIHSDIFVKNSELAEELSNIMLDYHNIADETRHDGIFTEEERARFISDNLETWSHISSVLISIMAYLVIRLIRYSKLDENIASFEIKDTYISANIFNILQFSEVFRILAQITSNNTPIYFYDNLFSQKDYEISTIIGESSPELEMFANILLMNGDVGKITDLVDALDNLMNISNMEHNHDHG